MKNPENAIFISRGVTKLCAGGRVVPPGNLKPKTRSP